MKEIYDSEFPIDFSWGVHGLKLYLNLEPWFLRWNEFNSLVFRRRRGQMHVFNWWV
jgi:hypothetical protein